VPAPVANYLPYRVAGNLLFLAGQGPRGTDGRMLTGKVGAEVSVEEAYQRARIIACSCGRRCAGPPARSTASIPCSRCW
jgi:enamine deaminase RidA (YjgF/YER057c/UK114 family)